MVRIIAKKKTLFLCKTAGDTILLQKGVDLSQTLVEPKLLLLKVLHF